MSWEALHWAAKQRVAKAADKLILLALAERHNPESGLAYPSVAWLAEFGSLDRKTVMAALDRLENANLISDSGERAGKTLQVKCYRLHIETVPKTEQSQKRNSPVFPEKQSQKRDTDTVREPVGSEAKASSPKRATKRAYHRLPPNWTPTRPLSANCRAKVDQWPPGAFEDELESFRAWAANAKDEDGKGRKLDWDDAFGNWIRAKHNDRYSRQLASNIASLRGHRPDPALDLLRAASAAEDREDRWGAGPSLPAVRSS